jgi:hypothetical protein
MKRLLQEIQFEKEKKDEEERQLEIKHQLKLDSLKQLILDALQEHDDFNKYIKNKMIKAAKENRDTIYLITLPEHDPDLFPECNGSKISKHTEDNCDYMRFIANVFNEILDKNVFNIKLEYHGWASGGCMDIYVKFTL